MSTTMKGLLKGLRYISQIFEVKDEEEDDDDGEMQIGFPTDVKHVAHIGWDGPVVTSPAWMSDFQSSPEKNSGSEATGNDRSQSNGANQDGARNVEIDRESPKSNPNSLPPANSKDEPEKKSTSSELAIPKASRRQSSAGPSTTNSMSMHESSSKEPKEPRRSRRNKSTEVIPTDSLDGSSRRARRHQRAKDLEGGGGGGGGGGEGGSGLESQGSDSLRVPRQSRRKKKSSKTVSQDVESNVGPAQSKEQPTGASDVGPNGEDC